MTKKIWKSIVSFMLVLAMILTTVPTAVCQVNATAKPSLNVAKVTLTKGMQQSLKLKNAKSNVDVRWSSKDKSVATVNKNGIVKGVKDGNTTINCIVKSSRGKMTLKCAVTVKTPKFAETSYAINIGESISPVLENKYSEANYKWTSQNTNIAKVSKKGKVIGIGNGRTTITVKITIPKTTTRSAKVITKKIKVIVSGTKTVTNQEELNRTLKNESVKKVIIKTGEKVELNVPQGNYKNVELVVDAPNANIINNGHFKNITIKQIGSDTWTENANENILILDALAGHIVITDAAKISEIRIISVGSNFKLDVIGNVDKISIGSQTKIDIKITGAIGSIDVNSRATVSIDGSSISPIAIKVGEGADGTTLNSNIKLNIVSSANAEINLLKGAEESSIQIVNEKKLVEVTNNTVSKVEISNGTGKNKIIEAGENVTVDGSCNVTNTTNENGNISAGGTSTGGGASSSGNLARIISYFDTIQTITAGTSGENLKTIEQIKALLPTQVTANDINGQKFNIKVTDWINENNYSDKSSAGNYTFSAVLGNASLPYSNPDNKKATVRVHVNANTEIELGDNDFLEVTHYENTSDMIEDAEETVVYYSITNTSDKAVKIDGQVKFYDKSYYLVKTENLYGRDSFLYPGTTGLYTVSLDYDITYNKGYLDLSKSQKVTYSIPETAYDAVKVESEKNTGEITVKLTNTSDRQISSVDVRILFLNENGEVEGCQWGRSNKVYGVGYTDTLGIKFPIRYWKDDKGVWQEKVIEPVSYKIFISGAYFSSEEEKMERDNIPSYLEVTHYENTSDMIEDAEETVVYYSITNTSDKAVKIDGQVKFYDKNDYLVKTENLYGRDSFLYPGTTGLYTVSLDYDITYNKCFLDLSKSQKVTYSIPETAYDAVKVESEKSTGEITVKLTNTSDRQISSVDVQILFFNENGEVEGCQWGRSNKVYGVGYTDTLGIKFPIRYWKDDKGVWQEKVIEPVSYKIFVSSVYYTND